MLRPWRPARSTGAGESIYARGADRLRPIEGRGGVRPRGRAGAYEWLESMSPDQRPVGLSAACFDGLSRHAAASGDWLASIQFASRAVAAAATPARQERLGLLRRRVALLPTAQWDTIAAAVAAAKTLLIEAFRPEMDVGYACGTYHSRPAARTPPVHVTLGA